MRRRCFQSFCLAALLTAAAVMPSYGAVGPGQAEEPIPDGVTEEQWSKLNDQAIEFDELPDLVRYFNPSMLNTVDTINNSIGNLQYIHDEMRSYISDLKDDADQLKDSGATSTPEGMEQYMTLEGMVKGMKTSAEGMGRSLEYMSRPNSSVNSNINQVAKNYTYYANQVMIGYNSAVANRSMLQKVAEISSAALEAKKLSHQLGMATEADLLSANKEVLSAQSSLLNISNTIDSLRRSLCFMTGYSTDAALTIGGIPELDMGAISAIDLEADTAKAIGNNYNLISERHGKSNQTTTGMKNKEARVSDGEQNVAVTMQSLYQAVIQAKSAYDASCTSYEKAVLEKGKADRSFQLGMLSKISNLQAQMAFLQAESAKQSAYNTLYQAYDTYQWAVDGIIMTSAQ
ncbi:hypothetical protein [Clostridium sp. Marseille-P2415]|uniref:hypothetical protein n=1 Tax=Clostridium sp. Marseille-P2415 TaxID=1805471 RepID=UPI0009886BE7|nr:hypothetical protein [Clostridium sp. Marseille-P2415]